jgi:ABC-type polysaccharide/polyol phosphate transport system ATPase subunit
MIDRIVFEDVTIDFKIYDINAKSLRHALVLNKISSIMSSKESKVGGTLLHNETGPVTIRALSNINLRLKDGDRLAIVGHNGSGKSTLLRVAAGIYEPQIGRVKTSGRIMPLFNMMEGMSQDATGLEIIGMRAALLGFSRNEINLKRDEIVDFCELGDYIKMPIRTYSTGMQVRLAFAITTAVKADILIMDEFIGAGDAGFFDKAQKRLKSFVDEARVLILATHSPDLARQWCNKGMLLSHGNLAADGNLEDVLEEYKMSH